MAQGGTPPRGTATSVTYYAAYTLNGGTAAQSNQTYAATAQDTSGVWVKNGGALTLTAPAIVTSGNTSSQDNSSFYGVNAGLLVTSGSATVTGGSITTSGSGGSGSAVATDRGGGTIAVTGSTITTSGNNSAGIYSTRNISATNSTFTANGAEPAVIEGAKSITLTGCTLTTNKQKWGVMIYQSMSDDASGV